MAQFARRLWQGSPLGLSLLLSAPAIALLLPRMAIAQSITPANDSTNTRVTQTDNRYDIDGGVRSSDGVNLFHDFERFGLSVDEIANFLSDSDIQNILSRVSGGEASFIDGLIQVSGSDTNLFLMNPAGIVFGANARLDVGADFTATTATGIGFENGWFSTVGDNDYANLVGTPSQFVFDTLQPGSLTNAGDLSVSAGQNLTLLGGTVVNTGTLSAPGGAITLTGVPGESLVRISQEGHLLNLEIASLDGTATPLPFTPLDLPTLLTGNELSSATDIEVNPDGSIRLTGSSLSAPSNAGTVLISGVVDTRIEGNVGEALPQIAVTGDRVALLNATLDASSTAGGGNIRIGGDYQGNGTLPNAQQTYVDTASVLSANGISSELTTTPSHGGRIIIWADDTTAFYGSITAMGGELSGNGGFAEISGYENLIFQGTANLNTSDGLSGTLLLDPTNIIISGTEPDSAGVEAALPNIFQNNFPDIPITIAQATLENAALGNANIVLESTGNITLRNLNENRGIPTLSFAGGTGDVTFTAGGDFEMPLDATVSLISPAPGDAEANPRTLTIQATNVTTGTLNTRSGIPELNGVIGAPGGNVIIRATEIVNVGDITAFADSRVRVNPTANPFNGGTITIEGIGDDLPDEIDTSRGILSAGAAEGSGGNIVLRAEGNITTASIITSPVAGGNRAGDITITSQNGIVDVSRTTVDPVGGEIFSGFQAGFTADIAGDVTLKSPVEIITNVISVGAVNGGSITITSPRISLRGDLSTSQIISLDVVDRAYLDNSALESGDVLLNGLVILEEDSNITTRTSGDGSNSGNAVFSESISDLGDRTLSINAADIDFQDSVNVSELDLTANNAANFDGNVISDRASIISDSINFQDTVNINELDITAASRVSFEGTVNSDRSLTINATDVNFQDTVNAGLLTITSDIAEIDSDIITTDDITFNSRVVLNNPVAIEAQNSAITLNNGLNTGNNNLTLSANEVNFQGTVTGDGSRLTLQPSNASQVISLGTEALNANSFDLSQAELENLDGFSRVIIGGEDGTGGIIVANPITLNVPTRLEPGASELSLNNDITVNPIENARGSVLTLGDAVLGDDIQIETNDGTLRFRGTVNGDHNLTLNAGEGNINFRESVGNQILLSDLRIRNTGVLRVQDGLQLRGRLNQRGAQRVRIAGEVNVGDGNLVWRSPLLLIGDTQLISSTNNIHINSRINRAVNAELEDGLELRASVGNISTRNINLAGEDILLVSDEAEGVIRTGNLNSSEDAGGGDITVQAGLSITTDNINSSAITGDAGDVFLDPENDIQVGFINAESENGQGGDITATTQQFFRATDTFTALDGSEASLSAIGGTQGGDITLTHDGGARLVFFNVGALDLSNNGVAGAIATGTLGNVNLIAPLQGFLGPYEQLNGAGDIRIITTPQPLPEADEREETPPHINANGPLEAFSIDAQVFELEAYFTEQFEDYWDLSDTRIRSLSEIRSLLQTIERETGVRPAIIYATFTPQNVEISRRSQPIPVRFTAQESDILHLIMIAGEEEVPIQALVPDLTRGQVSEAVDELLTDGILFNAGPNQPNRYLPEAQQFYQWLVAPLRPAITAHNITNLVFVLDEGLRSVPLAALHDTQDYIVADYSLGLMPSVSLTDTRYSDPRNADVLAMGISDFSFTETSHNLRPLPAVPLELQAIGRAGWDYDLNYNAEVTIEHLIETRQQRPFGILHLATHAAFAEGQPERSYIQFWQESLGLDQVRTLGLSGAIVNLMVLSACETALGSREAELGFAGFAAQASVRSVLATLWAVDDRGTMILMDEFYRQLRTGSPSIKAEALRQAQLALLRGDIVIDDQGRLRDRRTGQFLIRLGDQTDDSAQPLQFNELDLSHPYIWSGFTIIGSPW